MADLRAVIDPACRAAVPRAARVLLIVPDGTRTFPLPQFVRLIDQALAGRVSALTVLIALGTHQPMSDDALRRHLGLDGYRPACPLRVLNHRWDMDATFVTLDTISADEASLLSGGRLEVEVPVRINRLVLEHDVLLVCGPVFPHEVAGFSGGSKYFFPGISGQEVIDFTHWLGALITSYAVIGRADTPVRAAIDRAAAAIPREKLFCCAVVDAAGTHGVYMGGPQPAWRAAVEHSARLHVTYCDHAYRRALAVMPTLYDDLWTGAKGMYKLEPVIADGGEIIIVAPHIAEVSYTHGHILDEIGYHVRDYFVAQWERFRSYPWGVLAHSTHLRGAGTYHDDVERPRIRVTLATGIPEERCTRLGLGYLDPETIDLASWRAAADDDLLFVPHAGERLFRLRE
jgi:nickel-dependent lactate racemase